MKRVLFALAAALLLATLAPGAHATEPRDPLHRSTDAWGSGTPPLLLEDVACNASAAARTWTGYAGRGDGFAIIAFQLDFTQTAATALTFTPTASLNDGDSYGSIPPCDDTTDGDCALTGASTFSRSVSASENIIFRVDFLGATAVKLLITCTGGGASDTFSLYGRYTTQ